MTPDAFVRWLTAAPVGEGVPYHRGLLAADAQERPAVRALQRAVAVAEQLGLVRLTQRRVEPEVCDYWATRTDAKLRDLDLVAGGRFADRRVSTHQRWAAMRQSGWTVGEIAADAGVSAAAVSQALKRLGA